MIMMMLWGKSLKHNDGTPAYAASIFPQNTFSHIDIIILYMSHLFHIHIDKHIVTGGIYLGIYVRSLVGVYITK